MTTYTAIPNGSIDQDSPIDQPLMTLLRDNPIAIAEGSAGAPKVELQALGGHVASAVLEPSAPIFGLASATTSTTSTAYVQTPGRIRMLAGGTVRLKVNHRIQNAASGSDMRVLVNGVVQGGPWSTNSTTNVLRTVDLTVAIGDIIAIEHRTSNATHSSTVTTPTVGASNGCFWTAEVN